MSSTETSGAPAESTATTPAPDSSAAPASFGSTRGSGLARGKRQANSPASATPTAAPGGYTPTAIEIINAPREYQNPFAPAEPAPSVPPGVKPERVAPAAEKPAAFVKSEPASEMFPLDDAPASAEDDEPAELNILPPERPKTVAHQTWESEGFSAAGESESEAAPEPEQRAPRSERQPREERPRREERSSEPVDIASIPEKFLYVRPGYDFVPTDLSSTGRRDRPARDSEDPAPREQSSSHARPSAAPAKSGGFFGWIKSLFGGGSSAEPTTASPSNGEHRSHHRGGHRHRGGRGDGASSGSGEGRGGSQGGRRRRGGRGRSRSYGGGSGGPSAT